MDTLGSEVGTKMMSAVKAKLIELGSGGSSGYIDDELPDYVMIMVANKRSKQQMIEDLNLFLGSNTEPFVNWLHQVLQKLQEVTLSATAAAAAATSAASLTTKTKRKLSESTDKKDKKEKKKKMKRSLKEKSQERTFSATAAASTSSSSSSSISTASTTTIVPNQIGVGMTSIATAATTTTTTTPSSNTVIQSTKTTKTTTTTNPTVIIPSITDVFAEHFIQRAKETIRIESSLSSKVKNEEKLVRASIGSTTPPPASAPTTTPQSISSTTTTNANTTIISSAIDDKQQKNQSSNESAPTTDILSSSSSTTATTINPVKIDDGFDIPTISEISKNQSVTGKFPIGSHKEVVELAELQKIIYQAKRQLKSKGLVDDDDFEYNDDDDEEDNDDYDYNDDDDDRNRNRNDRFGEGCSTVNQNVNAAESEDEDFINLKADGEELDDDNLSGLMDMDKQQYSIGGTQKAKITTTTTTTISPKPIGGITHRSNKSNKTKNEFNPIQSGHESDTKNNRYKKNNRSHISYEEEMDRELLRRTTVVNTIKDNEKIITKKPSIMDRLGVRPTTSSTTQTNSNNIISLSAHRRTENEMYTSAAAAVAAAVSSSYRRQRDDVNESERFTSRTTGDNPNKIRIPITERLSKPLITISNSLPSSSSSSSSSLNDKRGSLNKDVYRTTSPTIMTATTTQSSSSSSSKTELSDTLKSRIGSRVIKAPPKPQYDEDYIEVPINSVVKIQPRPKIPSNKQACTHLLLRAVAEAQKSTAFIKPKPDLRTTVSTTSTPSPATSTSPTTTPTKTGSSGSRSTKLINDKPDLFTKTYRDNNNLMLKTRSKQKDSIVIQIPGDTTINYNNNNVDDDDDENNHQHHSHHPHHPHHHHINNDEDDDDDDDIIVTEIDDEMVVHRIEDDDDDDEEHDDHVTNMEPESIEHDEEYIPEVVTSQRHITSQSTEEHEGNYVYIPVNINNVSGGNSAASVAAASAAAAVAAGSDDDLIKSDSPLKNTDDIYDTKTQFVVTLDGAANFNNKSNDDQNLLKIIQSDRIKSDESKIKHKHHHHHHHNHNQHQQHSHQSLSSSSADRQDKDDEHQNSQKIIITKTVTNDRIEDNNNNNNNKLHKLNKADLNHDKIIINNNNNIAVEESIVNDDYVDDDENVNELRKIVERSSKKNRESKKLESKLNKNLKRSRVSPIKFDLYSPSSSKTTTGSSLTTTTTTRSSSTTTISRNNLNPNHKLRSSNATISITSSKYHSNESQSQPIKKSKTENDLKKMIHHSKYENSNNININIIDSDIDNYNNNNNNNNNNKEEQFNSDNIQIELPKENRRVKIMKSGETNRKYENIPSLSSAIISGSSIVLSSSSSGTGETGGIGHKLKSKSRCTYFPICGKGDNCEFMHPTQQLCKTFPNCTFGDKCLYIHPKCKFDLTCNRLNCNFYHSIIPTTVTMMTTGGISSVAAPLSSHVVPVSNYKTITATTVLPALCRFFPNCTNTLCTFYHPKPCHFGKFCNNKMECQFYHFDLPPRKDKLKWVAATTNPQSSSSSSSTFGSMNITSSIIPQSSTTAIN